MKFKDLNSFSKSECFDFLVTEIAKITNCNEVIFLRYVDLAQSLVVDRGLGWSTSELRNIGIDLNETDPHFTEQDLLNPAHLRGLSELVTEGLGRQHNLGFPLQVGKEVKGIVLLASNQPLNLSAVVFEEIDLILHIVGARLRELSLLSALDNAIVPNPVTGLHAKTVLFEKAQIEVSRARRIEKPVSIIKIKLANYYDFTLAHTKKDVEISLKAFAKQLQLSFRNTDIIVHWSQDEFFVLLPHTNLQNAILKSESVLDLVRRMDFSKILNEEARFRVVMGVSEYPSLCNDAQSLISTADKAMTKAHKLNSQQVLSMEAPL